MMGANDIIMARYPQGRKFCSRCGRWRLLIEFHPRDGHTALQSACKTCDAQRNRKGDKPRPPRSQIVEARNKRRREQYAVRRELRERDPVKYREYLETQRLRAYDKRRANGTPTRDFRKPERNGKPPMRSDLVPAAPLLEWLDSILDVEFSMRVFTLRTGIDGRQIWQARDTGMINWPLLDRIVTGLGRPDLFAAFTPEHLPTEEEPWLIPERKRSRLTSTASSTSTCQNGKETPSSRTDQSTPTTTTPSSGFTPSLSTSKSSSHHPEREAQKDKQPFASG